jgi:hypothetical protein
MATTFAVFLIFHPIKEIYKNYLLYLAVLFSMMYQIPLITQAMTNTTARHLIISTDHDGDSHAIKNISEENNLTIPFCSNKKSYSFVTS